MVASPRGDNGGDDPGDEGGVAPGLDVVEAVPEQPGSCVSIIAQRMIRPQKMTPAGVPKEEAGIPGRSF